MHTNRKRRPRARWNWLVACGVAALAGGIAAPVFAARSNDDWPLFRGNSHSTGVATTELPDALEELWKVEIPNGSFETTAAIVDGVVYVGDFHGQLMALDLQTGEKKWATPLGIGFSSAPAVREGRIYIGDLDGILFCVDQAGVKQWEFAADMEIDSCANFYQDKVLFGSQDSNLYCLKASDGALLWKVAIDDQIRCAPTIVENRAFIAGCDGKLHVIDIDSGSEVGSVGVGQTGVTPAALGDRVFFGDQASVFHAVDWRRLKLVWEYRAPAPIQSSPAIGTTRTNRRVAIFGCRARQVFALDCENGDVVWSFNAHSQVDGSPVVCGDRVVVPGNDGRLYLLNVDDGQKVWEKQFAGGFAASPAAAAGRVVIATRRGVVYCLGAK
jgi:outer membrane protein assembly factor BamB